MLCGLIFLLKYLTAPFEKTILSSVACGDTNSQSYFISLSFAFYCDKTFGLNSMYHFACKGHVIPCVQTDYHASKTQLHMLGWIL